MTPSSVPGSTPSQLQQPTPQFTTGAAVRSMSPQQATYLGQPPQNLGGVPVMQPRLSHAGAENRNMRPGAAISGTTNDPRLSQMRTAQSNTANTAAQYVRR